MTDQDEARYEVAVTPSRFIGNGTLTRLDHPRLEHGSRVCGENGAHRNLTSDEIDAGMVTVGNPATK